MQLSKNGTSKLSASITDSWEVVPEDSEYYEVHRKALQEGYELHYEWITENLFDGLSSEECKEVLDILDMYSCIKKMLWELRRQNRYWWKENRV